MSPGYDERRPGERAASNVISNGDNSDSPTDRRVYQRQHWAFPFIRRGGEDLPLYGSDEWLALPEDHPAKVASCVRAAELWAQQGDRLAERLRVEVELSRQAHKKAEDADYVARRDAHRKEWKHLSVVRSFPWNERGVS